MPLPDIVVGRGPEDMEKFGLLGTGVFGRHVVGEGEDLHFTNPVRIDFLRPHIIGIFGKRGSGKSYSLCIIAEEMMLLPPEVKENLCAVMIDTMGIFWSLREPNDQQAGLLAEWGMKPRTFDMLTYIPVGHVHAYNKAGLIYDKVFALRPSELSPDDWSLTFNISLETSAGVLLEKSVRKCKGIYGEKYSIDNIIDMIESDEKADKKDKLTLSNRVASAKDWGIFSDKAFDINEMFKAGSVAVLDLSLFGARGEGWSVRSLVVGLLARKIYEMRIKARKQEELARIRGTRIESKPLVWFVADEAHAFIPNEGNLPSVAPILVLALQGREPGISMVLATQRPNKLHEDIIAQTDLVISHRLTAKTDINALRAVMQTYLLDDIQMYINRLPKLKGSAVILDDNSERIITVQARPRLSWHSGGSPAAVKERY